MSLNSVTLIGRLGADPEVTTTSSGKSVCNVSLATDRGFGENKVTDWHRLTLWEKQAEILGQYVKKGQQIAVQGRIEYRSYEKDGETKYSTDIVVERLTLLAKPADAEEEAPAPKKGKGGSRKPKADPDFGE